MPLPVVLPTDVEFPCPCPFPVPSCSHAVATAPRCPDHNATGGFVGSRSGDWSGEELVGYPSALAGRALLNRRGAVETPGNRAIGISRNPTIGTSGRLIRGHPMFLGDHPERFWGSRGSETGRIEREYSTTMVVTHRFCFASRSRRKIVSFLVKSRGARFLLLLGHPDARTCPKLDC